MGEHSISTDRKDRLLASLSRSSLDRKDRILASSDSSALSHRKARRLACVGISERPRSRDPTSRRVSVGDRVRNSDKAPVIDNPSGDSQEALPEAPVEGAPEAGAAGADPLAPAFLSESGPREYWRRPPFDGAGAAGVLSCLYLRESPYLHVPLFFHDKHTPLPFPWPFGPGDFDRDFMRTCRSM